jgi:hypothetical protein
MERQTDRVKLHNLLRTSIYRRDEDQGQKWKHESSGGAGSEKMERSNESSAIGVRLIGQIQRFGEPPYKGTY